MIPAISTARTMPIGPRLLSSWKKFSFTLWCQNPIAAPSSERMNKFKISDNTANERTAGLFFCTFSNHSDCVWDVEQKNTNDIKTIMMTEHNTTMIAMATMTPVICWGSLVRRSLRVTSSYAFALYVSLKLMLVLPLAAYSFSCKISYFSITMHGKYYQSLTLCVSNCRWGTPSRVNLLATFTVFELRVRLTVPV